MDVLFNEFEPGLWRSLWMISLCLFSILSLINLFNFEETTIRQTG
jgi:hypothetical protein